MVAGNDTIGMNGLKSFFKKILMSAVGLHLLTSDEAMLFCTLRKVIPVIVNEKKSAICLTEKSKLMAVFVLCDLNILL